MWGEAQALSCENIVERSAVDFEFESDCGKDAADMFGWAMPYPFSTAHGSALRLPRLGRCPLPEAQCSGIQLDENELPRPERPLGPPSVQSQL